MSALRDALPQYVALRRALGTKLREPARTLEHFLEFLEREGAEFITSELALRWAMEPQGVQRATWARRLGMVRRFATWFSTIDARTQVPPHRLLAPRRRRNKPHIFTEQEIARLMAEAARLASPTGLRALTYIEEDLAGYESIMASVWPLLAADSVDLHGDQSIQKGLALFVSLLYLRHPHRIAEVEKAHSQLVKMFDSAPKDQDGLPLVDRLEYKGVVRPFDNSDWQQYKAAGPEEKKGMFVNGIRQNATYLAQILMEKRWSVVFSEEPAFITSDAPVAVIHPTRDVFGVATPGTVVSFPLSPTRVLMMDDRHDQPKGRYYPLSKSGPGPANMTSWRNCERFMITSRHPDDVCAEILAWTEREEPPRRCPQAKADQN